MEVRFLAQRSLLCSSLPTATAQRLTKAGVLKVLSESLGQLVKIKNLVGCLGGSVGGVRLQLRL